MCHRFVHIGDLHLGPNERNADRLAALDQIIAENIYQPVSAWLIPGDLNHARMTIADGNALDTRLMRMADHAPVVLCYGNHDLPGDLDGFARLHAVWPIYVIARPEVIGVPLATTPFATAAIFVLPYPTRAGLVAAGTPPERVPEAARAALDTIFLSAAAKLADAKDRGLIPLMIGHINVGGAVASSGQPSIGKEIELDPTLLHRLNGCCGYVGLNHIHKAQFVSGARYAGSICRLDWGEVEAKSYNVLLVGKGDEMLEGASDEDGWLFNIEQRPLDVAPMYHVEGELTRDGFAWSIPDAVVLLDGPWSFDGADVRVRFRFAAADKALLDFDLVKAPFVGARRIDTDPIAEHSRAQRAPEVASATSLDEKIRAYVTASGVTWTPSFDTKLAALQQPDGAAFLTELESHLSGAKPPMSTATTSPPTGFPLVPDNHLAGVQS